MNIRTGGIFPILAAEVSNPLSVSRRLVNWIGVAQTVRCIGFLYVDVWGSRSVYNLGVGADES